MGRSTFEGPVLSGDNRFGPLRDVGYADLVQTALLDFAVTTNNTQNYGGGSGIFVTSNNIPNSAATIYNPQAGVYSNTGPTAATAPTADATGTVYRGAVFLLPQQSSILNIDIEETNKTEIIENPAIGKINMPTFPYCFLKNISL